MLMHTSRPISFERLKLSSLLILPYMKCIILPQIHYSLYCSYCYQYDRNLTFSIFSTFLASLQTGMTDGFCSLWPDRHYMYIKLL